MPGLQRARTLAPLVSSHWPRQIHVWTLRIFITSRLQYLLWTLRFSKSKKVRFEDQIETFPFSFQRVVLARNLAIGGGELFNLIAWVTSCNDVSTFSFCNATLQAEINFLRQRNCVILSFY